MELNQKKKIDFDFSDRYEIPLKDRSRYLVLYGGRGSGKSEFAARKLILRCLFEGGHRFLAMRKIRSRCRESIALVFILILKKIGIKYNHNLTAREISFHGFDGRLNIIMYDGLDDPDKIKSIKGITGVWLEEATEFTKDDFLIIDLSLREATGHYQQIMLSFNPDEARARWLKKRFFTGIEDAYTGFVKEENAYLHHSTVDDNPIEEIRNEYKRQLERIDDPVYEKIFRLGVWAIARGIIYRHPRLVALADYPAEYDEEFYGLDFGFNNPSVLIWIGVKDQVCYLRQIIFETGLTTNDLIDKMKGENVSHKIPIYADPSAPDKIEEVKRAGFNCKAASAGKGSVHAGIMVVRSRKLVTCEENEQLNDEFITYKWKEDRSGEPLDEPAKFDDHGMDGVRYGIFSHLGKRKKARFKVTDNELY